MTSSIDVDELLLEQLTPKQLEAYRYLDKVRIVWRGKPINDRDDENARQVCCPDKLFIKSN